MGKYSQYEDEKFVMAWLESISEHGGINYVAEKTGLSKNYVSTKANYLRGIGVNLPRMQKSIPVKVDELNKFILEHERGLDA